MLCYGDGAKENSVSPAVFPAVRAETHGRHEGRMKRVLLKDIAEIKICSARTVKDDDFSDEVPWLTQSSLLPFNELGAGMRSSEFCASEDVKAVRNDILVRRLAPTGVNFVENDADAYVHNNIIMIRARDSVCASYLAAYLDEVIGAYVKENARSTAVASIGRKELREMPIELPDDDVQRSYGAYWLLLNKKKRLEKKLADLEGKKNKEIFNLVRTMSGGEL